MKLLLVLTISIVCLLGCSETEKEFQENLISGKELIEIIGDSSYNSFKKLIDKIGYKIFDSSLIENDKISVTADRDDEMDGNILTVHMNKDSQVNYLHFSTEDKSLYLRIKSEMVEIGFKQLGSDLYANEFEMGNLYFTTIERSGNQSTKGFDFLFMRKK